MRASFFTKGFFAWIACVAIGAMSSLGQKVMNMLGPAANALG